MRFIVLDSTPLGLITQRSGAVEADACRQWLAAKTTSGLGVIVPEIVDYELRRELIRSRKTASVGRLDRFIVHPHITFLLITSAAMKLAAQMSARARQRGTPTADPHALDGDWPNYAASEISFSLRAYVKRTGKGRAVTDNAAFRVSLPHRESFSPDAAYYVGPRAKMKFFDGAPRFAVEVRSEGDYGPAAECELAAKRKDYFDTGTLVVWDVDLLSRDTVRVYRASDPLKATIYRRGDMAEAEPAVPGWQLPVEDLWESDGDEGA